MDARRRRNELEYPVRLNDGASVDEARESVSQTQTIIEAAKALFDRLDLF